MVYCTDVLCSIYIPKYYILLSYVPTYASYIWICNIYCWRITLIATIDKFKLVAKMNACGKEDYMGCSCDEGILISKDFTEEFITMTLEYKFLLRPSICIYTSVYSSKMVYVLLWRVQL